MVRRIKLLAAGAVLSLAAFLGMPAQPAQAGSNDYCREYTRTVYIGGRSQDAYGTACLQSDGSWMIVGEGLGNDIPDNVSNVNYVIHDNRREVIPTRVVYYDRPYYRSRPVTPIFTWYNGGHYRNGHNVVYRKYNYNNRYDRHDRHDRHDYRWDYGDRHGRDHKGRGNGHR